MSQGLQYPLATRAAIAKSYAAGERLAITAARHGCSVSLVSSLGRGAAGTRRARGRHRAPPEENRPPVPEAPLRPPLYPWYSPPPIPHPLQSVIVRIQLPMGPLWPSGVEKET